MKKYLTVILLILVAAGGMYFFIARRLMTDTPPAVPKNSAERPKDIPKSPTAKSVPEYTYTYPDFVTDTLNIDSIFRANGLQDVRESDSSIRVHLKYATEDNFMNRNVYGNLRKAYLRPEVAEKLAAAQAFLTKHHPGLYLIVYDAARPQRVQFTMWNLVVGTEHQIYVAPPVPGSLHNFGCSVDVSLTDSAGQPLDMGTPYDSFDPKSEPRYEKKYFKAGDLTETHLRNRKILRKAMLRAGFIYMVKEWWHFDAYPPEQVIWNYQIIK